MKAPDLAEAVAVLRAGGVVAYPTDTLYGLAADPRRDEAVEKLYAVKGRPSSMAIPLIAADLAQAQRAGRFEEPHLRLARACGPGPLTIVVPAAAGLSSRLFGDAGGTVAVRVPAHALARELAAQFGFCLTSTSANLSGEAATAEPSVVRARLGSRLDFLLDAGPAAGGPPSTIVRLDDGRPALVRAGAIAWDRVLKSLE